MKGTAACRRLETLKVPETHLGNGMAQQQLQVWLPAVRSLTASPYGDEWVSALSVQLMCLMFASRYAAVDAGLHAAGGD